MGMHESVFRKTAKSVNMTTTFIQGNKNINFEARNCHVFVAKKVIILRLLNQILRLLMSSAINPFSFSNFTTEACKTVKYRGGGGGLHPSHVSYNEFVFFFLQNNLFSFLIFCYYFGSYICKLKRLKCI